MDKSEWETSKDPWPMVTALRPLRATGQRLSGFPVYHLGETIVSERKLRLFALHNHFLVQGRGVFGKYPEDPRYGQVLAWIDGEVDQGPDPQQWYIYGDPGEAALWYTRSQGRGIGEWLHLDRENRERLAPRMADLLREVIRNPYDPLPAFPPKWRTQDVMDLAGLIYRDRAWDQMPILADALEDAGCTGRTGRCPVCDGKGTLLGAGPDRGNPECTNCQGTGRYTFAHPALWHIRATYTKPHVVGCWALDHILGKE